MKLSLLVLKTTQPDALATFYQQLGMEFDHHRHGTGPLHYSATLDQTVIEIYPLPKDKLHADDSLRLGFTVADLDVTMHTLKTAGVPIFQEARQTEWGYHAIVEDPDGRKVELTAR